MLSKIVFSLLTTFYLGEAAAVKATGIPHGFPVCYLPNTVCGNTCYPESCICGNAAKSICCLEGYYETDGICCPTNWVNCNGGCCPGECHSTGGAPPTCVYVTDAQCQRAGSLGLCPASKVCPPDLSVARAVALMLFIDRCRRKFI